MVIIMQTLISPKCKLYNFIPSKKLSEENGIWRWIKAILKKNKNKNKKKTTYPTKQQF